MMLCNNFSLYETRIKEREDERRKQITRFLIIRFIWGKKVEVRI